MIPIFNSLRIQPDSDIDTSSLLLCHATAEDENDDLLQYEVTWSNGDGVLLGESIFLQLSPEVSNPGDEIICTAAVTDGRSEPISQSVSVF